MLKQCVLTKAVDKTRGKPKWKMFIKQLKFREDINESLQYIRKTEFLSCVKFEKDDKVLKFS